MFMSSTMPKSSRARPRSPSGFYGYDIIKQYEQVQKESRPKSQSKSITSLSSTESRLSAESANSGSRRSSISTSLRGLKRKTSARVPDVPPPLPPSSPSVSELMSPSFDEDDNAEATRRLRQLHKVSRTLGENIPAELILGPGQRPAPREETQQPRRTDKAKRRASLSLASISPFKPSQPAVNSRPPINPTPPMPPPMPAYSYPKPPKIDPSMHSQPDTISPIAFAEPDSAVLPPTTTIASILPDQRLAPDRKSQQLTRSKSLRSMRRRSSESIDRQAYVRPQTPFMDAAVPIETFETSEASDGIWMPENGCVVRRERHQGWSGEWNQNDMQDVISKLRNLK